MKESFWFKKYEIMLPKFSGLISFNHVSMMNHPLLQPCDIKIASKKLPSDSGKLSKYAYVYLIWNMFFYGWDVAPLPIHYFCLTRKLIKINKVKNIIKNYIVNYNKITVLVLLHFMITQINQILFLAAPHLLKITNYHLYS